MTTAKRTITLGVMKNIPTDTAAAVAEFIKARGVTRCPTACATRTIGANVSEADRLALAAHYEASEAGRMAKIARFRNAAGVAA